MIIYPQGLNFNCDPKNVTPKQLLMIVITQTKLQSIKWEVFPHPSYSPDATIVYFCLYLIFMSTIQFWKSKKWGRHFLSFEEIKILFSWNEFTCRTLTKYCDPNFDYFVEILNLNGQNVNYFFRYLIFLYLKFKTNLKQKQHSIGIISKWVVDG